MKKVVLYVFLAIALASSKTVFSQTVVQGLKVYEGNISNMEVFFPNLKRAEIKNTFEITDWVYLSNNNVYSVARFYFPEYRKFMYFLIENYTEPYSDVYKISNTIEYNQLITTMERYGYKTTRN
ncbi:hypothetical protein [Capnocytophaga leadbetteri]|jgi:hypothetical protein